MTSMDVSCLILWKSKWAKPPVFERTCWRNPAFELISKVQSYPSVLKCAPEYVRTPWQGQCSCEGSWTQVWEREFHFQLRSEVRSLFRAGNDVFFFFIRISMCQIDLEPYVENPSIETYRENNTHGKDIMGWMTMNHIHPYTSLYIHIPCLDPRHMKEISNCQRQFKRGSLEMGWPWMAFLGSLRLAGKIWRELRKAKMLESAAACCSHQWMGDDGIGICTDFACICTVKICTDCSENLLADWS